jgi:uncharacterized membrane protein
MEKIRPECGFCPDADHCHIDNKEASARLGRCLGAYTVAVAEAKPGYHAIGVITSVDGAAVIAWDGKHVSFRGRYARGNQFTLRDFLSSLGVTDDDLAGVIRERMGM